MEASKAGKTEGGAGSSGNVPSRRLTYTLKEIGVYILEMGRGREMSFRIYL